MTLWKRLVSMAFFLFCGCVWHFSVFTVEGHKKLNSKHRKRGPTSVFCFAKLLVGKFPKPSKTERSVRAWTDEKERYK